MTLEIIYSDALYYPYINIRDVEWLKATLLVFPHVLRMIPGQYYVDHSTNHFIDELSSLTGSRGQPLVGAYDLESQAIGFAAEGLRKQLELERDRDPLSFRARFSRESARDFGRGNDSIYQIHRGKVTGSLGDLLEAEGLMWQPDAKYGGRYDWRAMHPLLGESIMSCFAVAAARDAGCEIVTDDPSLHLAVSEMAGDSTLSGIKDRYQHMSRNSMTTTVAQMVIMNTFDVKSLSLKNIVAMAKEEDALYEFRSKIAGLVNCIPDMTDRGRQDAFLKNASEQIISQWFDSHRSMSQFTKRLFGAGLIKTTERWVIDMMKAAVFPIVGGASFASGTPKIQVLGATAGLAVGVVYYAANQFYESKTAAKSDPLRYLSFISNSGNNVLLSKALIAKRGE